MKPKHLLAASLTAFAIFAGCATKPAPKPAAKLAAANATVAGASAEASSRPAIDIDYSAEDYRVVAERDLVCTVLKNGMTVIAKRIPSPVLSVQGLCKTGSIYEGKWLGGGLSHLLEHLLAGGTNARRSEQQNRDLLQSIGNNSNAFTTTDNTCFFVNTTPDHMAEAVDLVTGWLFTSTIPQAEYEREYEVVQRELEKDNGEADWVYYQLTNLNRYLVHPTRMPVVGYQEVIRGLSRDDVFAYYKSAYVPQNIIFAVAGNADPEDMIKAVRKYAGNVPPGRVPDKALPVEPDVAAPRLSVATFPKLGQAKLQIAFPAVKQYAPDMYPLDVLSVALGGGESSLLVEELRDKRKLVTAVSCTDNTPSYVAGTFSIDMELTVDKIKPATDAVMEILAQVKKEGVAEDRVKRAITQLKATDAYQRQSAEALSTNLCYWYMTTGYPEDVVVAKYQKVTAAQVKAAANKFLDTGKLLTTALLPEEAVQKSKDEATLPAAVSLLRQSTPTTQRSTPAGPSQVTRAELEDGTILLLKRVDTAPVVSIQLYSLGGVTAEDAKTNGLGNLAMQTVDRGTKTRSAEDIATFFDSIGGQFETQAGNNAWVWQSTCLKDDFAKAIEVFADVVKNASFPDDEVKDMKDRVAAAIESQDRDWFAGGNRYFRSVFFGPTNSPYQFTPLGTKDRVAAFTAADVRQWYANKVLQGRKVLAVYGDVDITAARQLVAKHFAPPKDVKNTGDANPQFQSPASTNAADGVPSVTVDDVKINAWDNPESVVFIGFKSASLVRDRQRDPLIMADTLTSGYTYPTGYIFETLRGLGLVYDANAQNFWGLSNNMPGTFWAYAACDPKNVDKCIDQMLLQIARLQGSDQDIDATWFKRAQNLVATADAMEHETAQQQAAEAALDELYGLGYNYHAKFGLRINAVTIDQVRQAAKSRLRNCVIAVSTSKPDLVKAKAGPREYKEFPPVDLTPKGVEHDKNSAAK